MIKLVCVMIEPVCVMIDLVLETWTNGDLCACRAFWALQVVTWALFIRIVVQQSCPQQLPPSPSEEASNQHPREGYGPVGRLVEFQAFFVGSATFPLFIC